MRLVYKKEINPFNMDTTGISYYDNFLKHNKIQNRKIRIRYITSDEYLEECANKIFKGSITVDRLKKTKIIR